MYVKHFSGAQTRCMKDYLKTSIKPDPNHFIFHLGTNELITERLPEVIAKAIVDLAVTLKSYSRYVSISVIILRTDNTKLNEKGYEVNFHLKQMCK